MTYDAQAELNTSVLRGNIAAIRKWIKRGADPNVVDDKGGYPLLYAACRGYHDVINALVSLGAIVNRNYGDNQSPAHAACQFGYVKVINALCKHGARLTLRNEAGHTPMHVAALHGQAKAIDALIAHGVDAVDPSDDTVTVLEVAVCANKVDVVRTLAKHSVDLRFCRNSTSMFLAAGNGFVEMIKVLAELGVDVNIAPPSGEEYEANYAMHSAARRGFPDAIRTLASLGGNVDCCSPKGVTPLSIAAAHNKVSCIDVLVELGAMINKPSLDGNTAIFVAVKGGHISAVQTLIKHGADINSPNFFGQTPVLQAAHMGRVDLIKLLYKEGADMAPIYLKSTESSMADIAARNNHSNAVSFIEKTLKKLTKECDWCSSTSKRLKLCSRCEKVRYCSRQCQVNDYKRHKEFCVKES